MIRNVTLAELTEHLAEHFESVRQGTTLRVMDGDEPLATIVPGQRASGLVLARAADRSLPLGKWRRSLSISSCRLTSSSSF
jgi:antitoxin (DNA-binding transcriptional repressor) of toxin-antitoxin stability system